MSFARARSGAWRRWRPCSRRPRLAPKAVWEQRSSKRRQSSSGRARSFTSLLEAFTRAVLIDGGLLAALRELSDRSALPVGLTVPDVRFAPPIEAAAYFVCSEALANVGKHAAASRAQIDVAERDGSLIVSVRDDGRGGATLHGGSGLRGLADRVQALGGRLSVTSPTGGGTQIVAELPLS